MKLIIDVPEEIHKLSKMNVQYEDVQIPLEVIANGTPIPDNATNRDVIEIMFSNEFSAKKSWWDAPYQKGGKE